MQYPRARPRVGMFGCVCICSQSAARARVERVCLNLDFCGTKTILFCGYITKCAEIGTSSVRPAAFGVYVSGLNAEIRVTLWGGTGLKWCARGNCEGEVRKALKIAYSGPSYSRLSIEDNGSESVDTIVEAVLDGGGCGWINVVM